MGNCFEREVSRDGSANVCILRKLYDRCAGIVRQRQAIPSSDQGSAATAAAPTDGAPASTRPSTAANEPLPRDAYSQQARLITRSQQQVAANSNKLKQLGRADDNMDDHLLQERRSSSGGHSDSSMKKRVNPLPPSPEALTEECPTCLEEYTPENPKITMECSHGYHLSCIYEWKERNNTCPTCNREMKFSELT